MKKLVVIVFVVFLFVSCSATFQTKYGPVTVQVAAADVIAAAEQIQRLRSLDDKFEVKFGEVKIDLTREQLKDLKELAGSKKDIKLYNVNKSTAIQIF